MKSPQTLINYNTPKAISNQSFGKRAASLQSPYSKFIIQPKLSINQPNDVYEQEADAVVDKVMRMTSADIQTKPLSISDVQRKCAHCEAEEKLQRKELNGNDSTADSDFENYVGGLNSGGQSLPDDVRSFYEPRFGYDFSNVKVHTDAVAAKSAQSINALAYTNGNNIVFNEGQNSPNSDSGKRLLGHELTHVMQQNTASVQTKIQRKPHTPEPLGNLQVVFDPKATLIVDAPHASSTLEDIGDSDTGTFSNIPRGASGTLTFPVTETWGPATQPPGGGGTDKCDFCEILHQNLGIIPDIVVAECKALGISNVKEFLQFLNDVERRAQDPCTFLDLSKLNKILAGTLAVACSTASGFPPIPTIKATLAVIITNIRNIILNTLPAECRNPNRVIPGKSDGTGNATSTLTVRIISTPGGALQLVGPPPQATSNGVGAELVAPVDFSESSVPDGATIFMQPTIRSTVLHNNGSLSTPETHMVSHPFKVQIQVQPPPAAKPYDCPESFGPFVIASDRFVDENGARQNIHDWYFGLSPQVREDLENGNGLLRVTGRASSTGSKTFNLDLAEKRAKKVQKIITDFAGTDAHLRSFALGEFGAQRPDNTEDANERRVDVDASGEVPGEKAVNMQGEICAGHLGETTSSGAIGPVTTPTVETPGSSLPGISPGTGTEKEFTSDNIFTPASEPPIETVPDDNSFVDNTGSSMEEGVNNNNVSPEEIAPPLTELKENSEEPPLLNSFSNMQDLVPSELPDFLN